MQKYKFKKQSEMFKALNILEKISTKVTVSKNSMTCKNVQIQIDDICDVTFTISIKELNNIISRTSEFILDRGYLTYSYSIDVADTKIEIKKNVPIFEDDYKIPCGDPDFSIVLNKIDLLNTDDYFIEANKNGTFTLTSQGDFYVKTTYSGLDVLVSNVDKVEAKVRHKDIKVLPQIPHKFVFNFFETHILVCFLEQSYNIIIMVPILI